MNDEMHAPLFSIIVPVYNVEEYLRECIESVLSQSIDDYELILVNDGSTDRSEEICEEYAGKQKNIRLICKENGGSSSARNYGIKNAKGKYLLFLDSDDFWSGDHCLETLKKATEKSYDIVMFKAFKYFNGRTVDSYGDYDLNITNHSASGEVIRYMIKENKQLACAWNKMVKREYILENDIFFKEGIVGEDIDWTIRLFRNAKHIFAINEELYMYRQNREGSITSAVSSRKLRDLYEIIKQVSNEYKGGNAQFDNAVKSFMAFEYGILLYTYPVCDSSISLKDIKEYEWLLQYAIDKKSKAIKVIYKVFGYNVAFHIIRAIRKMR